MGMSLRKLGIATGWTSRTIYYFFLATASRPTQMYVGAFSPGPENGSLKLTTQFHLMQR
jgi:hypothetical protein